MFSFDSGIFFNSSDISADVTVSIVSSTDTAFFKDVFRADLLNTTDGSAAYAAAGVLKYNSYGTVSMLSVS